MRFRGTLFVDTAFPRTSLRAYAQCQNLASDFQVVRDFFGYLKGPPAELSVLTQIEQIRRYHLIMNIIRVGYDTFTTEDDREVDEAVHLIRQTMGRHGLGLGSVFHAGISTDAANGRDVIADEDEARELTREWSVDNDKLDVFVVRSITGPAVVYSNFKGPKNKDRNGPLTGVVVGLESSNTGTAYAMAWGVCHYLGAKDSEDPDNLMSSSLLNGGELTSEQATDIWWHYFVTEPCGYIGLAWSGGV